MEDITPFNGESALKWNCDNFLIEKKKQEESTPQTEMSFPNKPNENLNIQNSVYVKSQKKLMQEFLSEPAPKDKLPF